MDERIQPILLWFELGGPRLLACWLPLEGEVVVDGWRRRFLARGCFVWFAAAGVTCELQFHYIRGYDNDYPLFARDKLFRVSFYCTYCATMSMA